ncbi:MAG: hypothetical protein IJR49_05480 [Treponema sp.]|nr:hypothetical protein [Treponema sp.]
MRKLLCALVLIIFPLALNAQVGLDPSADFYEFANTWYRNGLVSSLPQFKPYPVQTIQKIFEEVIQNGDEDNQNIAKFLYKSIFGKPWNVSAVIDERNLFTQNKSTEEKTAKVQASILLEAAGDVSFSDMFGLSYRGGLALVGFGNSAFEDLGAHPNYDTLVKSIKAGPLAFNFNSDAVFSFSHKRINLMAAYSRVGFSPFMDDDVAFSSTAHDSPYILFSYNGKYLNFVQYFGALAANNSGNDRYSFGKFLLFQSLKITLGKKRNVSISLYDAVVYGNRFDVSYFIPVPKILISSANGYDDNVVAGLVFDWNIINGFAWLTNFAFDHLETERLFRFKFTGDYRFAAKTEFSYTPLDVLLKRASLSYTIVMPYTYSHTERNSSNYNYGSYTNWGRSLGTELPPNSDRFLFTLKFNPVRNFTLNTSASIIRHANIYENVPFEKIKEATTKGKLASSDGSLHSTYIETDMFLSQPHIMYICNGSIQGEYTFPRTRAGSFSIGLDLMFTLIYNAGVDAPIYNISNPSATDLDKWAAALHEEYRALLSCTFKYRY